MSNRNAIIDGLQKCAAIHQGFICESCEYTTGDCAVDDAIAMLKAQEPRLLTLDEIHDSMVVWLEAGKKFLKIVDDDGVVLAIGGSERMGAKCFITVWDVGVAAKDDEYNITWRAWSQRPTKEQREGTAWQA